MSEMRVFSQPRAEESGLGGICWVSLVAGIPELWVVICGGSPLYILLFRAYQNAVSSWDINV